MIKSHDCFERTWLGNNVSWFVHLQETWLGNNVSWFVHLRETWLGNNVIGVKLLWCPSFFNAIVV